MAAREVRLENGRRIRLVEGDITKVPVDAMANAANGALAGGGGVDGAIHRAGGPQIMRELDEIRPRVGRLSAGQAVATTAGRLPARYVFHAVGPIYRDGRHGEPEALASCYRTCLRLAEERACRSISFPAISTGVYGYPAEEAAQIAIEEVKAFLNSGAQTVEEVVFVQYGRAAYALYEKLLGHAPGL
jgi:O-acetyl-ADP-ribose deacetylase (regulator of RNase III)